MTPKEALMTALGRHLYGAVNPHRVGDSIRQCSAEVREALKGLTADHIQDFRPGYYDTDIEIGRGRRGRYYK